MNRYVAFLRGMNLGRRRITNEDLRVAFQGIGFPSASTYRASGNVIFEDVESDRSVLTERIESGLREVLGYEVPTVIRSAEELVSIVRFVAFPADVVSASAGKVQVTLLAVGPEPATRAAVLAHATEADRLAFGPRELYWLPEGRMTDSVLDGATIERALGLVTTRTLGTLTNIVAKVGD